MAGFSPYVAPEDYQDCAFQGFIDIEIGQTPYDNPAFDWNGSVTTPFLEKGLYPQFSRVGYLDNSFIKMDVAVFTPWNAYTYQVNPNRAWTLDYNRLTQSGDCPIWHENNIYWVKDIRRPIGDPKVGIISLLAPLISNFTWGKDPSNGGPVDTSKSMTHFPWTATYGPLAGGANLTGCFIGNEIPGMIYSNGFGGPQLFAPYQHIGSTFGTVNVQRSGNGYSGYQYNSYGSIAGMAEAFLSVIGQVGYPATLPTLQGTPMFGLVARSYAGAPRSFVGILTMDVYRDPLNPDSAELRLIKGRRFHFQDADLQAHLAENYNRGLISTSKYGWFFTPSSSGASGYNPHGVKNGSIFVSKDGKRYWIIRPTARDDLAATLLADGTQLQYAVDYSGYIYVASANTNGNPNMKIFTTREYVLEFAPLTIPVAEPVTFPCMECPDFF